MDVSRLGVKSDLQLPAYTTATSDLSCICDLCHSSRQGQILNPLSEAGDRTHILMDTSQVLNPLSHNGNSLLTFLPESSPNHPIKIATLPSPPTFPSFFVFQSSHHYLTILFIGLFVPCPLFSTRLLARCG